MNNEIKEKIKRMELKYKFIKDEIKQELISEFVKKLKRLKIKIAEIHYFVRRQSVYSFI